MHLTITWQVNLMMCLTNGGYHRRDLSYWFHIIRNSLYLPSRPFSSTPRFMWLCPFLIRVTDRRSGKKDGENERESGDFVTGVFVCMWMLGWVWVWTSLGYLPYRFKPSHTPPPVLSLLHLIWAKWCVILSENGRQDWDLWQTITTVKQWPKRVKKPCTFFFQWSNCIACHRVSADTHTSFFYTVPL